MVENVKFILFLIPLSILLHSKNNFQVNNIRVDPLEINLRKNLKDSSNYFLDTIQNGLKGIENGKVVLETYKEISLPSENNINNIIMRDNYLVPVYDNTDPKLKDIKIYKYADVFKRKDPRSKEIKSIAIKSFTQDKIFLEHHLKNGLKFFQITWIINNKKHITTAVFDGDEFIYDNLISNIVIYSTHEF